jgi:PAS domain S-box-containing protein
MRPSIENGMKEDEPLSDDEALRNHLAALVASSDDAILSKSLEGIILSWNRGAALMFGYSADEVIGKPVTILIPPQRLDEEPAILERIRRGERIDHYQTTRVRKDGVLIDISLTVSPIRNAAGKIVGASKIARDITAQKRVDERLQASDARFRIMADSAPVLIWIADTSRSSIWFNKTWREFTGRSIEDDAGFGWTRNVYAEDLEVLLKAYSEHFETRTAFRMEFRLGRSDGQWRWVLGNAVPLYEGPGNGFSGYISSAVDITEFRQAQLERDDLLRAERSARTEAERLSRVKDEFLATLSHELRTPLNAILGWSTLLRRMEPGSPEHAKGLETIERNARVQSQIISDLLDMSRIISGKVQLDVQPVDLHDVISGTIESVRPSAEAKRLRLRTTLAAQVGQIRGDPARLQQVFWNLLTNAVKFTPSGGRIDIVLEQVNSHLEICVADSGIGIRPEFLAFVFDRFRQADSSTTRRHGGLGLGLSIVKHLVELHGGSVRVKSQGEGQGSTFIVALPISAIRSHERASHEPATFAEIDPAGVELPSLSGVTALIVDDEADARILLDRLIQERGGRTVMASSAAEALAVLQADPVDIVVSDIGMPEVDGYAFIRRVRQHQHASARTVMAIALTAYARAEDRQRALLAGYQMHLAKPVDPRELIAGIASLLHIPKHCSCS